MSAEIVIIIIGVVFVFFAFVNILKIKDSLFRSALGILGVLLIIYGGYSYESTNPKGQIEQVEIENKEQIDFPIKNIQVLSPIEGDSVNCRILTMGVYPDSLDNDIWVLLKPSDNKYYPQSDHTNTSYKKDGKWQVITRFGGDMGESFDIVVYETDSLASQYFSSTIENWKASLSYPGLKPEELPKGAHEVERIVVSLKDNCRDVF